MTWTEVLERLDAAGRDALVVPTHAADLPAAGSTPSGSCSPRRPPMTADLAEATVGGTEEPRHRACRLFAEELRGALAELPFESGRPVPEVTVSSLGVRDAFTSPAPTAHRAPRSPCTCTAGCAGRSRPVAGRACCGTCLRRRWQGVRSVGCGGPRTARRHP
ncbi:hypothetical protein ACR6C2_02420 [Streptomyces sp. INA 01156]